MSTPTQTIDRLEALLEVATKGKWFTVEQPWRRSDVATWIVAGSPDPHAAKPVLNAIEIDEWPAEQDGPDYTQSNADLAAVAALKNAAPLLLALAREAMASRPFIDMDRIRVWSDAEGLPGLPQHTAYLKARATTDRLAKEISL
jgi:hypothetical protein